MKGIEEASKEEEHNRRRTWQKKQHRRRSIEEGARVTKSRDEKCGQRRSVEAAVSERSFTRVSQPGKYMRCEKQRSDLLGFTKVQGTGRVRFWISYSKAKIMWLPQVRPNNAAQASGRISKGTQIISRRKWASLYTRLIKNLNLSS